MTRRGTWQVVPRGNWPGRLQSARDFLALARDLHASSRASADGLPIVSNGSMAAIAYADAMCIKFGGIQSHRDHPGSAIQALRQALGDRAGKKQVDRLRGLVAEKDGIQNDQRPASMDDARRHLDKVERFAAWAEAELARP